MHACWASSAPATRRPSSCGPRPSNAISSAWSPGAPIAARCRSWRQVAERGRPAVRGGRRRGACRPGRCHRHHNLLLRPAPESGLDQARDSSGLHGDRHQGQAGSRTGAARRRRPSLPTRSPSPSAIGEAQHAFAAGTIAESAITPIGAVIDGTHSGRSSDGEITLFDGTGVGLQDLAVADLALRRSAGQGGIAFVDL